MDLLETLKEVQERLTAVEADNKAMRAELADALESKGVALDHAHVNHVMDRFFHHDRAAPEVAPAPVPKFDPYTGQPLQ